MSYYRRDQPPPTRGYDERERERERYRDDYYDDDTRTSYDRRGRDGYSHRQYSPPRSRDQRSRTPPRGGYYGNDRDFERSPQRASRGTGDAAENIPVNRYREDSPPTHSSRRSPLPGRRERGRYYDRDRPRSISRSQSRSQSRSRARHSRSRTRDRSPQYGGIPCRDVILEGLGIDVTEDEIKNELENRLHIQGLTNVTIIKDKKTGLSRQFAFAQFATTLDARRFLRDYYPSLQLFVDAPKVRIAFSKTGGAGAGSERSRAKEEDEWTCRVCFLLNFSRRTECFKCHIPRHDMTLTGPFTHPTPTTFKNDGSRDVEENVVSQFLLFRELSEVVNEEMLAKAVIKLTDRKSDEHGEEKTQSTSNASASKSNPETLVNGARENSVRRVLLVRNRKGGESWRFGFVEFAGFEDSKAAYEKYLRMPKFTINSRPVKVSYIHAGVFVPVYNTAVPDIEKYTFVGSNGLRLAYWDEEAYVSELLVSKAAEQSQQPTADKREESFKVKGEKDGSVSSGKPTKKRRVESAGSTAVGNSSKKALPSHLQFWQNRHLELHGVVPESSANNSSEDGIDEEEPKPSIKKRKPIGADSPVGSTIAAPSTNTGDAGISSESFADLNRLACLLCARQFKSAAEVHKHERLSELHRTNMGDEKKVAIAREKLTKAGIKIGDGPVYRDRAKERRAVFGQPKKPETKNGGNKSSSNTVDTKDSPTPPVAPPAQSKGAALLSKMGWSSGQGLGAEGTGIVAPVIAEMYAEGVGLGAAGSKVGEAAEVAGQNTGGGYKDFLQRAKEKAKQRYEELS